MLNETNEPAISHALRLIKGCGPESARKAWLKLGFFSTNYGDGEAFEEALALYHKEQGSLAFWNHLQGIVVSKFQLKERGTCNDHEFLESQDTFDFIAGLDHKTLVRIFELLLDNDELHTIFATLFKAAKRGGFDRGLNQII